ncbi:pentatricopeptide repeat-containing protein At4g19191, mitochondrial [Nymphaea colorata]|uniref:Uncharacterized protein n=1 Tax=Nymphaea colorata TaxID=210225 RepID=A0A5K1D1Q6_9MAGN|nr:pentatricopeptide repeat-containing protein At4g19191, mitochondrial [Nymphaea colorata]
MAKFLPSRRILPTRTLPRFSSRLFGQAIVHAHLKQIQRAHAHLLVNGLHEDDSLLADTIFHAKQGSYYDILYCRLIFDRIPSPTVSTWNCLIRLYADSYWDASYSFLLYREMRRRANQPDHLTFPFLLKGLGNGGTLSDAVCVHTHVLKSGFLSDLFVQTSLMSFYTKFCCMEYAHQIFDQMSERDTASWNVLIGGYSQKGCLGSVFSVFQGMRRLSYCSPDCITVMSLMQACVGEDNRQVGESIHCLVIKNGMEKDVSVKNTLIAMLGKCEDSESAELLFSEMDPLDRNTVSWNALISGCCCQEDSTGAVNIFNRMLQSDERPDLGTILSLVSALAEFDMLPAGGSIHCYVLKAGFDSNISAGNAIISMYSKCGDAQAAYQVFAEMRTRNRVTWTSIVSGFAQSGCSDEAKQLFKDMLMAGEKPDSVTIVAMLSACSISGDHEYGKWIHDYTIAGGLITNVIVCNALVDMYAKCGSMSDARQVFERMQEKNIISWTTMILGYAMNGEFKEALNIFSEMLKLGIRPNHVTFLAVLSACVHGGLLEKSLQIFHSMTATYHILPRLEHYACVADLLGRQGNIQQALDLIQSMPVRPDAGIWGALLGACRIHHEIEIGEFVAERLLELDPSAVSHVSMANIYAGEGKWEGAARLRMMMKSKKVKKTPGCSFVQANGSTHSFAVEDRSHPEHRMIYEVVDGLALQLKGIEVVEIEEAVNF